MDLLKALKRTTYLSAMAVLALGATEACAASATTVTGHVSASVQGNLAVTEVAAVRFGNLTVACAGAGLACTPGGGNLTMDDQGVRSVTGAVTDVIVPLTQTGQGAGAGSTADLAGVPTGTDGTGADTGGQGPGIYDITTSDASGASAKIYVTFANQAGAILDKTYDPTASVDVIGPTAQKFTFDTLEFKQTDQTHAGPGFTYNIYNPAGVASDTYGQSVTTDAGGHAEFQVGGVLHTFTTVAAYAPGKYFGTFYVMVSY